MGLQNKKCDLVNKPRTVNRQINRANANVGGDVEAHYKVNFYYPFIDHVIQHLTDFQRRSEEHCWQFPHTRKVALVS